MNKKIIQRAVAKSIVWDTGALIRLINKYEPIDKNVSYANLLLKTQNLLATNAGFANDFTKFLLKHKRLVDYNTKKAVGAVIVTAITTLTNTIVSSVSRKEEREFEEKQLAAQNTQQIMNMMMQEEQTRINKDKQDNMLIISAVFGMVLITGLIIYTQK